MLNHIVIMGRLTRDPELRRTGNGTAVAGFTVAVDRDYAAQGQEKETDFIDCVAWAQKGEFVAKYFTMGSMIVVSGRLQIRNWTDKDGNKRRSAEVNADNIWFGESKGRSEGRPAAPAPLPDYNTPQYDAIMSGHYGAGATCPGVPNYNPGDFDMLGDADEDAQLPF